MKLNAKHILFALILALVATACKYFFGPDLDWSGFSPIIAIALFAGLVIRQKEMSFLLPLAALFISDVIIQLLFVQGWFPYSGFYKGQWLNYVLLLLCTLTGWYLKGRSYAGLAAGAIVAPTLYFLASNFMVWMNTTEAVYARSFSGLVTCYEAALPFYRNSLIATFVFLPMVLVAYNVIVKNKAELKLA
jgi:hypothetical protein